MLQRVGLTPDSRTRPSITCHALVKLATGLIKMSRSDESGQLLVFRRGSEAGELIQNLHHTDTTVSQLNSSAQQLDCFWECLAHA